MNSDMFRGIPLAMQQDGWWLSGPAIEKRRNLSDQRRRDGLKTGALIALIALGDALAWQVAPGASLALFGACIVAVGLGFARPGLPVRSILGIGAGTALCLLPLVELVQPLSVLIALVGLSFACATLAGLASTDLVRGALRLWWVAPAQSIRDGFTVARQITDFRLTGSALHAIVLGWALPVGATLGFGVLLSEANPVLERVLALGGDWSIPTPDLWRLWFWVALGMAIWPVLIARRMQERLRSRQPQFATAQRQGIVNGASVARSLVAFNALFVVQTAMDVLFLYGNAGLPEGISAAAYAHRGAYPLLVTALLAGLFAVLARPHIGARPVVRWLMLVWLGQTLALVVASVWRLDTYVDIYGLTRLRVAAYIWIAIVALGLLLVVMQIRRNLPTHWMIARSAAIGAVTLYICAFVNFDGFIARYNLTRPVQQDIGTLCRLSEGALPALVEHWTAEPVAACRSLYYHRPELFEPADWREWGFRNWRVRRSLAAMTDTTNDIAVP